MKKLKGLVLGLGIISLFAGCEEESGYGNYIIGVENRSSTPYSLGIFIDGDFKGTLVAQANRTGIASCSNMDPTLQNVYIVNYVPSGKHTIELKESGSNKLRSSGTFNMKADGCTSQQAEI